MFRRKAFWGNINWTLIQTLIETLIFFDCSVHSVFRNNITTDIRDFRDINHECKRANPLNLFYLCSRKNLRSK
jgi:hypothetical protein